MTLFYIITAVRCSVCKAKNLPTIDKKTGKKMVQKFGFYRRKSDSKRIQRYHCLRCNLTFSAASKDPAYHQNKRRLNYKILIGASSLNSIRRMAKTYHTTRKTIARKLEFLGICCKKKHQTEIKTPSYQSDHIQFDEIHTIEHTKCKPYVVSVAVCVHSRKILGIAGATAPASGHLAKIAYKKYGYRPDTRRQALMKLFERIKPSVHSKTCFSSDKHPYYKQIVRHYYPNAPYRQMKGATACVAGQGELKKAGKDPLFCINHTFAMLRANINRLIRKTWCTTKDPAMLMHHLYIYMRVHNSRLVA